MIRAANAAPRWAVSFADLGLLLLGCFVYLHAVERSRGGQAEVSAPVSAAAVLQADSLFEPGEARLSAAGQARIAALPRAGTHRLVSTGLPTATARLDPFELASARTAALARALRGRGAQVEVEMRSGAEAQRFTLNAQ